MHHQSLQVWSQVGWVDNGHSFNVKHLAACLHASSSDSRFLLCLMQVQKHESVSLQQLQAWLTSHRWNMQQTQHLGWNQSRVKWVDEGHGLKCMRMGTQTGVHGGMHTCVSVTVPLACLPVARCFPNQVLSTSMPSPPPWPSLSQVHKSPPVALVGISRWGMRRYLTQLCASEASSFAKPTMLLGRDCTRSQSFEQLAKMRTQMRGLCVCQPRLAVPGQWCFWPPPSSGCA